MSGENAKHEGHVTNISHINQQTVLMYFPSNEKGPCTDPGSLQADKSLLFHMDWEKNHYH